MKNEFLRKIGKKFGRFFSSRPATASLLLLCLIAYTAADFFILGLVRRTFVFYSVLEGKPVVETRMVKRSSSKEVEVRRYIEETLLGPESPDLGPLFPRNTRILSLLYRDDAVYADFSEEAALPIRIVNPAEVSEYRDKTPTVFDSFLTMNRELRRNFPSVREVKFFIGGEEIFFKDFSAFFALSADNTIKLVERR